MSFGSRGQERCFAGRPSAETIVPQSWPEQSPAPMMPSVCPMIVWISMEGTMPSFLKSSAAFAHCRACSSCQARGGKLTPVENQISSNAVRFFSNAARISGHLSGCVYR